MGDSLRRLRRCLLFTVWAVVWTAASAHAQWAITPYLGGSVAGDVEHGKGGPGVSVGYLGDRLGFDFDFQRYQHFFRDADVLPLDPAAPPNCGRGDAGAPCTDIDTDAMRFMGVVVATIRIPDTTKWRPYASAGLGVIRAWTNEEQRHQNNLGFTGGGGVLYSLSTRVGLRGDLRYFRALVDENKRQGVYFKDYGFWQVAVGVTFGFPR